MAVRAPRLHSAKPLTFSRWWSGSYHGQNIAFVDQSVFFYAIDDGLRFHDFTNLNYQQTTTIQTNGIGVGVIAGNPDMRLFAFADFQNPPVIHLREYPSYKELKQFTNAGQLEFTALEFSSTDELLSLSSAPDYLLTIWNWRTGVKLAQCETTNKPLVDISFNPNSWYDIGILYRDQINFYTCERRNDKYVLFERQLPLELFNQTIAHNQPTNQQMKTNQTSPVRVADVIRRYSSRFSFTLVDSTTGVDKGASMKLVGFDAENEEAFQTYIDEKIPVIANSFCWGDKGYVFVGTADDSLIQILLQFDREKQPFRTTRFAEEERFRTEGSIGMFKRIRLHRLGLYCTGGDNNIRLVTFENQEGTLQEANNVTDLIELNANVNTITFNPNFNQMFICSTQGVDQFDLVQTENRVTPLIPNALGKIVDLAVINPQNEFIVTGRDSGALEAWSTTDGSRQFSTQIEGQVISHVVASPVLPLIVVATQTGYFYFYEIGANQFRLVHRIRLHSNDVRCLKFNTRGKLLVSAGLDNSLFLLELRTDQTSVDEIFQIIYRTDLDGEPFALDLDDYDQQRMIAIDGDDQQMDFASEQRGNQKEKSNETRIVIALNTKTEKFGRFLIVDFDWQQYRETRRMASSTSLFGIDQALNDSSSRVVTKTIFAIHDMIEDFLITAKNQLITIGGKSLRMCRIPDEVGKAGKLLSVEAQDSLAGLTSPGGHLYKNQAIPSWVIAVSRDGILSMIRASDMSVESSLNVHSRTTGGCRKSSWGTDSKYFASVAEDGSIVVFQTNYAGRLYTRIGLSSDEFERKVKNIAHLPTHDHSPSTFFANINDRYKEYEEKFRNANMKPPSAPREDASWLQLKEYESTLQHLDVHLASKLEIRNELERIRKELHALMSMNDNREDKARLDRREFDLDSEEQERQRKEHEAMIAKVREDTINQNLIQLMKREVIKQQCWDAMAVKGRCLESITNPNRRQGVAIVVENYPLLPRTLEELENIRHVIERRRIEMAEKKLRRQLLNDVTPMNENGSENQRDEPSSLENEEEQREQTRQSTALLGSVSNEFQVDTSILYNQFELIADEQKWTQIALLNDLIYKIKEAFNKEFENVYQRKLQELAKIRERNTRIKQIHADLDDPTPVWEPDLTEKEKPQLLFEVKESEIKVERFYTAEQLRQLEEQRLLEERRREQEKLDNWRERGLNDMMGGVLQVRREDELKKEIPKPPFALEKEEEDWTESEKQIYQQYLQKVKEQQDERDKLRKVLTAEASKINEQIQESCQGFEQILSQLHQRRILAQTAVFQEELKISRLVYALVKDRLISQLERTYQSRTKILEEKVRQLETSRVALEDAINNVDSEKRRLKGDDNFEKQFPREFADVPSALQEGLKRLLTKRPKMKPPTKNDDMNPYSGRQVRLLELELDRMQAESDQFNNAPQNIVRTVWDRFVEFRRRRADLDRDLRQQEQEEIVIKNLRSLRDGELMRRSTELEQIQQLINTTRSARTDDLLDLYIQFVFKQGQIESQTKPADFSPSQYRNTDVELIHRHEVETLNQAIIESANHKIRQMEKCKHVCNELHSMEWEKEKLNYEITDLKQRAQDITFLKVTRNVQEYLSCMNDAAFEAQKQREAQMLETTITKMKERFGEQQQKKEDEIGKLQYDNLSLANITLAVDEALQNANVNVYERKNIIDQRIIEQSKADQEERVRQVVRRRRLVDLAKAQAQEVAYLRAEVERLRMKTFPALVQIEH